MSDEIVTIAMYHDPMEAQMARNRLADEGIPVLMTGDTTNNLFGGMGGAFGTIHLQVTEGNYQRALDILEGSTRELAEGEPANSTAIVASERQAGPEAEKDTNIRRARHDERGAAPASEPADVAITTAVSHITQAKDDASDSGTYRLSVAPDYIARRAWISGVLALLFLTFGYSLWRIGGSPLQPFIAHDHWIMLEASSIPCLLLFYPPLQLYSLWLLARLASISNEDLSRRGSRPCYGALLVNGLNMVLFLVVLLATLPYFRFRYLF